MKLALLFTAIAAATAAGTFYGATALRAERNAPQLVLVAQRVPAPTAVEFGRALMGTANQFAADARIVHPDCVQAKPGRYMCSFVVVRGSGQECHIMQGRWTPNAASTITVTLAGRAERCTSLRDAIRSLD
jgi:hypothetical protein